MRMRPTSSLSRVCVCSMKMRAMCVCVCVCVSVCACAHLELHLQPIVCLQSIHRTHDACVGYQEVQRLLASVEGRAELAHAERIGAHTHTGVTHSAIMIYSLLWRKTARGSSSFADACMPDAASCSPSRPLLTCLGCLCRLPSPPLKAFERARQAKAWSSCGCCLLPSRPAPYCGDSTQNTEHVRRTTQSPAASRCWFEATGLALS